MLKVRDIVQNKNTGKIGVVVPTIYALASEGPLSVIYSDSTVAVVIECQENFEVLGHEEPVVDTEGCGVGRGENACRFCMLSESGFECGRNSYNHWVLVFKTDPEKLRWPTAPYPACKLNVN